MKSVPTLLRQKDRVIESLKLELEAARAEIERLKADNRAYALGKHPSRRQHSGHGIATSSPNSSVSIGPSYARPTAASVGRSKAVVVETPIEVEDEPVVKQYGSLVYVNCQVLDSETEQRLPGYLTMTFTAANKMSWSRHSGFLRRNKAAAIESEPTASPFDWAMDAWGGFSSEREESEVIDIGADLNEVQSLSQRSGLYDNGFFSTPAGLVHIRFETQLTLLIKTHKITRDALWHALRDLWPEGQKRFYAHGPRSVKFGRTELDNSIGLDVGQHLSHGVQDAVYGVVSLRNTIAHPTMHKARKIDDLMQAAHSLVCQLGDDDRAMHIRSLRDKLRQKSAACNRAIVAYASLSHLPGARTQPVHHQRLYVDIEYELMGKKEGDVIARYGSEIVEAAKKWNDKQIRPGEDDPEYLGMVEKRVADVRSKMVDDLEPSMEALDA